VGIKVELLEDHSDLSALLGNGTAAKLLQLAIAQLVADLFATAGPTGMFAGKGS
jgi:hypothetical protein